MVKEILSDAEEVTNLVRTINDFANQAEVAIRSLKPAKESSSHGKKKEDFERVGYTIQCEADAFRLMEFLNAFEHHQRFINVTGFKLTGAKRAQIDRGAQPVHTITLDLETYVYRPAYTYSHYDRYRPAYGSRYYHAPAPRVIYDYYPLGYDCAPLFGISYGVRYSSHRYPRYDYPRSGLSIGIRYDYRR